MPARVLCTSPASVTVILELSHCHSMSWGANFVDAVHIPLSRSLSSPESASAAATASGHGAAHVATVALALVFFPR